MEWLNLKTMFTIGCSEISLIYGIVYIKCRSLYYFNRDMMTEWPLITIIMITCLPSACSLKHIYISFDWSTWITRALDTRHFASLRTPLLLSNWKLSTNAAWRCLNLLRLFVCLFFHLFRCLLMNVCIDSMFVVITVRATEKKSISRTYSRNPI